ncbi:ABC-2 family transporter protein [Candidatus Woesearchaeota archaeon]|nr:ABC-2 family transporter protein [Candidatus Woesearchaeota archaeon]
MVVKHIKLHLEYIKIALSTAMEYRFNFFSQVFGMVLNDAVWAVFWLLFFSKFKTVGGWDVFDMLMLYSIITISFGISGFLFGNRNTFASMIAEGKLDFYMVLPKNVFYHLLVSRNSFMAFGDIIFGLIISFFVLSLDKIPLFILLCILSTIIFTTYATIMNSLAFWFGNTQESSRHLVMGTLSLSSYPFPIFKGFSKFLLLTVLPAGFMSGIPVEILKEFNLVWFLSTLGFSVLILLLAIFVFYKGLKRYESGNNLNVRM